MKSLLLILTLAFFTSCFQQSNSSSGDTSLQDSSDIIDESEGVLFASAFTVLNSKCIQCHTNYHDSWSSYTRESDWLTEGSLVVAGDANGSLLVKRTHGCGSTDLGNQMPKNDDLLSSSECAAITDWINGIEQN